MSELYLDKVFKNIREIGAFTGHGSDLWEFVYGFEHEPWWDETHEPEDVIKTDAFWDGFRKWLDLRFQYATRALKADIKYAGGWPLTVRRALIVGDDWDPSETGVGVYWTTNSEAVPHQGDPKKGQIIVLVTEVSARDVDWDETMRSRMDYMNGDQESEIRVRDDAVLNVRLEHGSIEFKSGSYSAASSSGELRRDTYVA